MPFSPDYSDYLRMKRIQKTIDVDSSLDPLKARSTYAYGAYNPNYQIGYLPPNLFLPGRLYPPAPAPEPPSDTFYEFAELDIQSKGTFSLSITLVDVDSTTKIDFGDGTIQDVPTDGMSFSHAYEETGTIFVKLTNPTNIQSITSDSSFLKRVIVGDYTLLETVDFSNASNLTTLAVVPDTMRTITIVNTAINTCELLESFAASLPDIRPASGDVYFSDPGACPPSVPGWTFTSVP